MTKFGVVYLEFFFFFLNQKWDIVHLQWKMIFMLWLLWKWCFLSGEYKSLWLFFFFFFFFFFFNGFSLCWNNITLFWAYFYLQEILREIVHQLCHISQLTKDIVCHRARQITNRWSGIFSIWRWRSLKEMWRFLNKCLQSSLHLCISRHRENLIAFN